jgi:hypothetical protein
MPVPQAGEAASSVLKRAKSLRRTFSTGLDPAVGSRFLRAQLLIWEPPGLCIGKVRLADGAEALGVIGEPALCEGQLEITSYGGWRAYIARRNGAPA